MAEATITIEPRTATPAADDVLAVTGTITLQLDDDTYSCELSASGWVSATRQHYPPEAYTDGDQGPQLVDGAQPRAMTTDELGDYCTQLLLESFVGATPLVKRTATNLLAPAAAAQPDPTGPEPQPEQPPASEPATEPEAEPAAAPAEQGAPPLEGSPAPQRPPM